ncbi:inovirus-type Gp2 protein [Pseudomonas sp.]|uniref:YagK/YfjJ domain-containing protein n=1 Tax=Pseudomonas sp. TaxID=306 RepID=UPI002897D96D|nr:inovirus-type Gp2 protein [Pseudomonas sp.]
MNSRTFSYAQLSQSDVSILIERLVKAIEKTNKPAYEISKVPTICDQVLETKLSKYMAYVPQMVNLFSNDYPYAYSEHLQAFLQACRDIGLERGPFGLTCLNDDESGYLDIYRTMNVLVQQIRLITKSKNYKRAKDDRKYQAKLNEQQVDRYTNLMLDRYSRTVVVRVDLFYREAARTRLRVEEMFEHVDHLIRLRRTNSIFEYEIGYICGIEQGEGKGFHAHVAFFFNGAHVRSDWKKGRHIGELWTCITNGKGHFHSCNDDKESYGEELGIGTIYRSDEDARGNVLRAMAYLTKESQYLRIKPEDGRTLRMGQI